MMEKYSDSIEARFTGRHQKCIDLVGNVKGKKILNIVCYNGWFEREMVKKGAKEVIGIDTKEKFIELAQKNVPQAKFLKMSVLKLNLSKENFDLATMFDVIEHLPKNKEKDVLTEIRRVLRDGCKLIISTPNANILSNLLDPAWYFGHRHYSPSYAISLLRDSGFRIEKVENAGGFYELFSIILLYLFKWGLRREIPFKNWFDKKRDEEYLKKSGFVTLFLVAIK